MSSPQPPPDQGAPTTAPAPAPAPARPRLRKRVLIPGLVAIAAASLLCRDVVRAMPSSADDPTQPSQGVHCAVRKLRDGSTPVRCVLILDHPRERVWSVITDYERYPQIFPFVRAVKGRREGPTRYHLDAVASSPLYSTWPFRVTIEHVGGPDHPDAKDRARPWSTRWDDPSGKLTTERGSWILAALGPDSRTVTGSAPAPRTLLAYTLDLKIAHVPALVTDNILMDNLPKVLLAVKQRLDAGAKGP